MCLHIAVGETYPSLTCPVTWQPCVTLTEVVGDH